MGIQIITQKGKSQNLILILHFPRVKNGLPNWRVLICAQVLLSCPRVYLIAQLRMSYLITSPNHCEKRDRVSILAIHQNPHTSLPKENRTSFWLCVLCSMLWAGSFPITCIYPRFLYRSLT